MIRVCDLCVSRFFSLSFSFMILGATYFMFLRLHQGLPFVTVCLLLEGLSPATRPSTERKTRYSYITYNNVRPGSG